MARPRIKLSELVDEIEAAQGAQQIETYVYFDRREGRMVVVSEEDVAGAADEEGAEQAPDWQQDAIEDARLIEADAEEADAEARFVALPDEFDVHEWRMMADFAASREDPSVGEELNRAIHGRGAFRYFRDKIHDTGIQDQWYAYRRECYRKVAMEWCEVHDIEWE